MVCQQVFKKETLDYPACEWYADGHSPVCCRYPSQGGVSLAYLFFDSTDGTPLVRRLTVDQKDDLRTLCRYPITFFPNFAEDSDPQPIDVRSLSDDSLLADCYALIDRLPVETLALMFEALLKICRGEDFYIHIVTEESPERIRLLPEMLLSCLPGQEALSLSYAVPLNPRGLIHLPSICLSAAVDEGEDRPHLLIDLSDPVFRADEPFPVSKRSRSLAEKLLRHETASPMILPEESLFGDTIGTVPEIPPFQSGTSLPQYIQDWTDMLEIRHTVLSEEAFAEFSAPVWTQLINQVVNAADLMEDDEFARSLHKILISLTKTKRGEFLGMSQQNLADLTLLLWDCIHWQSVDLTDPSTVTLLRDAAMLGMLLTEDQCGHDLLIICRIISNLFTNPIGGINEVLRQLALLSDGNPALLDQLQDCMKRYVTARCGAVRNRLDEFSLVDNSFMALSVAGYARFTDGIPDLRAVNKVHDAVVSIGGVSEGRHFNHLLDRMRRGSRTSRATRANPTRKNEMLIMLLISLILALIIAGVILTYFFF